MTDTLAVTLEKLTPYLQHKSSCATKQFWAGKLDTVRLDPSKCDCGLDQLAAALADSRTTGYSTRP